MAKVTIEIQDTNDGLHVSCDFNPPLFKGDVKTLNLREIVDSESGISGIPENDRSCLNCVYEPEWIKMLGLDYSMGMCKFKSLPKAFHLKKGEIKRFETESGPMVFIESCPAWRPKR